MQTRGGGGKRRSEEEEKKRVGGNGKNEVIEGLGESIKQAHFGALLVFPYSRRTGFVKKIKTCVEGGRTKRQRPKKKKRGSGRKGTKEKTLANCTKLIQEPRFC